MIIPTLLLEEYEILKDNLFLFFEGLAVLVLEVETIQYVLYGNDEKVTNVNPVAADLSVCADFLEDVTELTLQLLLSGFDLALERAKLAPVLDDIDFILDQLGELLQSSTVLLTHNNYKPQNHCS